MEPSNPKLQDSQPSEIPGQTNAEQHIVSQESLNSNYFQKSRLSNRNTTVSDKNSEVDKALPQKIPSQGSKKESD